MTSSESLLPAEFADLEPFAARWCLATEPERWAERQRSSIEDMRSLYEAVEPRYGEMLEYLDRFALDDLPDDARNLLRLALSFVMVSFPVEVWGGARIPDAGDASLVRISSPNY